MVATLQAAPPTRRFACASATLLIIGLGTPAASRSGRGDRMNPENNETEPKAEPPEAPLKNEPTPERAAEEKKKMAEAAELAKEKPSGAV